MAKMFKDIFAIYNQYEMILYRNVLKIDNAVFDEIFHVAQFT